jgi:heme/copper-type cytochrome/quinol oxidase subunit 2
MIAFVTIFLLITFIFVIFFWIICSVDNEEDTAKKYKHNKYAQADKKLKKYNQF